MDGNAKRWVVMRGPAGLDYQVIVGPWKRLETQDIPVQKRLGYQTLAVVATEQELSKWIQRHRKQCE